jgi:uncharacterized protein YhaN
VKERKNAHESTRKKERSREHQKERTLTRAPARKNEMSANQSNRSKASKGEDSNEALLAVIEQQRTTLEEQRATNTAMMERLEALLGQRTATPTSSDTTPTIQPV